MFSLKFIDMVKFKSLQTMYKASQNGLPNKLQSHLIVNSVGYIFYNARSIDKFEMKYARTSLKYKRLSVLGSKLFYF